MNAPGQVIVEFYGIPRLLARRAELVVEAPTVAEAVAAVERACPDLSLRQENGRVRSHFLLAINGQQFVTDLGQGLAAGDRLLLLSADVGG